MQIVSIIHPLNLRKSNLQFLHTAGDLNHVSAAIYHINCLKKSIDVAESRFAHTGSVHVDPLHYGRSRGSMQMQTFILGTKILTFENEYLT